MARHMIGLSVSFCIKDMIRDEVSLDEIIGIIGNTRFTHSFEATRRVLEGYKRDYWYEYPEKGEEIFLALLKAKKIWEPRQGDPEHSHHAKSSWVDISDMNGVLFGKAVYDILRAWRGDSPAEELDATEAMQRISVAFHTYINPEDDK